VKAGGLYSQNTSKARERLLDLLNFLCAYFGKLMCPPGLAITGAAMISSSLATFLITVHALMSTAQSNVELIDSQVLLPNGRRICNRLVKVGRNSHPYARQADA